MSKIRASFVCTENLSRLEKELNVESKIRFGKSFKGNEVSDAILADTIESMIGVMYISFGMPSIASAVIDALKVKENLKAGKISKDYKSELQEYTQDKKIKLEYKVERYTTDGGQENFRANAFIDGKFIAFGQGSTKREAEQNSAKKTLTKLNKKS